MTNESKFIAKPLSTKLIQSEASRIRAEYGVGVDDPFPICYYIETHLALLDEDYVFEVEEICNMPDKYAETFPDEKRIVVRLDAYEGAIKGVPRDLFTLAHELGHYILHPGHQIALARKDDNLSELPIYYYPEWQANTFAGQLLCPSDGTSGLTTKEIKQKYGVSSSVAIIQSKK